MDLVRQRIKQNDFLNKLSNIKIGRKTLEQEKIINNLERFYVSRQEVINFFRDYTEFALPDGSYSISDIRDSFQYILKKHGENIEKTSIQIYVTKLKIGLHLK